MSNLRRKSERLKDVSAKKYVYDEIDDPKPVRNTRLSVSKQKQNNQSDINGGIVKQVEESEPDSDENASNVDEESLKRPKKIVESSENSDIESEENARSPRKTRVSRGASSSRSSNVNARKQVSARQRIESDSDDFEDIGDDEADLGLSTLYSHKFFVEQCILDGNKNKAVILNEKKSKEKIEKLEHDEIQELLKTREESHVEERKILLDKHRLMFDKWRDLLIDNFNLLLYGIGSKKNILNEFTQTKLKEELRVVVHGFFPGLTVKEILNSITTEALGEGGSFSSPLEHVLSISNYLEESDIDLYLIIHNIDGASLANEKSISILSQLARSKRIHIVASVDHINSGILFDTSKSSLFKWLWFDVSTFDPYKVETAYENSMQGQQTENLAISSLRHVFLSLTPNAQGIFKLLAKSQLEKTGDEGSSSGLSFTELFRQCREAFLVNSDLTLRTQLIEFKDHNMLKIKKGGDGLEYLFIPVNSSTLTQFLEETDA